MQHDDFDDFVDVNAACAVLGGNRPIHRATLYRWIRAGRIAPPIKLGPNTRRFSRRALLDDIARIASGDTPTR